MKPTDCAPEDVRTNKKSISSLLSQLAHYAAEAIAGHAGHLVDANKSSERHNVHSNEWIPSEVTFCEGEH